MVWTRNPLKTSGREKILVPSGRFFLIFASKNLFINDEHYTLSRVGRFFHFSIRGASDPTLPLDARRSLLSDIVIQIVFVTLAEWYE